MAIYYYAVDKSAKMYFSAPEGYAITAPGIYHPENLFPNMVVMMNVQGFNFDILNDCSNYIPETNEYTDVTEDVYKQYVSEFSDYHIIKGKNAINENSRRM